jgi:ABC-2 type transport system permease protein
MNTAYAYMSGSRTIAAYLGDMRFELIRMIRTPAFAIPTLLFPAMFYVLFGVVMGAARGNAQMAQYTFATYGVFGAMAPGLFGFGVALAFEREQGLLTFKQALPMPPASLLLARMVMAMLFVAAISAMLLALAVFAGGVPLTVGQALAVFVVNVLGVLPFCAIGLFIGASVSGQAAPAIVNLIYIPMAFLSGLWFPLQFLPPIVGQIAPLWPAYHLAQLALEAVGAPTVGSMLNHVGALAGVTIVFFGLAVRKLGGSGFRMLRGTRGNVGPLRRAVTVGGFWIALGLIVAGVVGGNQPRAVVGTADTPAGASEDGSAPPVADDASGAPVGVAAPEAADIADFEGSAQARFGIGWAATDDRTRGGNSTVGQKLVERTPGKSHALEIQGEVGNAIQYPFVGTSFLPNGTPDTGFANQGYMDFSAKRTLRFEARGDGQRYTVVIMGPALDAIPAMYSFVAGSDWQEVRVPLRELAGVDLQRVKVISIGSMTAGKFRFQIDDVRVE